MNAETEEQIEIIERQRNRHKKSRDREIDAENQETEIDIENQDRNKHRKSRDREIDTENQETNKPTV